MAGQTKNFAVRQRVRAAHAQSVAVMVLKTEVNKLRATAEAWMIPMRSAPALTPTTRSEPRCLLNRVRKCHVNPLYFSRLGPLGLRAV